MRTRNSHLIRGDELVLLAKEETVLQGMIDRLIKREKWRGKETNLEKSTVKSFTWEPSAVHVVTDKRKLKNVECFKNLTTDNK
jgi:hypothetical protein